MDAEVKRKEFKGSDHVTAGTKVTKRENRGSRWNKKEHESKILERERLQQSESIHI